MSDNAVRRYGFFKCPSCNRGWESSWAWCYSGTNTPSSGQKCEDCPGQMVKPYKVEPLKCSKCGSIAGDCNCVKRNVDPRKPHRSDLCERCINGDHCNE